MNSGSSILIEKKGEELQQPLEQEMIEGVPVCGANFSSPVIDTGYYIEEIRFKIGNRLYIENAD
jgi:hypothetical protein